MKKPTLFFLLVMVSGIALNAQTRYLKKFGGLKGETAYCLEASASNLFVAGSKSTPSFTYHPLLIKLASDGSIVNTWTYNSAGDDAEIYDMQMVQSSLMMCGYGTSSGGDWEMLLIKADVNGNVIWSKHIGTPDDEEALKILSLGSGGFLLAGDSYGAADGDCYFAKVDTAGTFVWGKTLVNPTGDDYISSAIKLADGGFALTGTTTPATNVAGNFLIRTNSSGDTLWTKTFLTSDSDNGYDLAQSADGKILMSGSSYDTVTNDQQITLMKIDTAGIISWMKKYTVSGADISMSRMVALTDGGLVFPGSIYFGTNNSAGFAMKVDSAGAVVWAKKYPTYPYPEYYDGLVYPNGDLAFAGGMYDSLNNASAVGHTDPSGGSLGCTSPTLTVSVVSAAPMIIRGGWTITSSGSASAAAVTFVADTITDSAFCSMVHADMKMETSWNIYPNPNTGHFTTTWQNATGDMKISIFDLNGKMIFSENVSNRSACAFDLSGYGKGIYLVTMESENNILTKKVVVE